MYLLIYIQFVGKVGFGFGLLKNFHFLLRPEAGIMPALVNVFFSVAAKQSQG